MYNLLVVTLVEFIQRPNVLIAFILAIVGVTVAILAKRVARSIRHTKDIKDDDPIMVTMKVVGLVMILVALILMVVEF